jgi:hypothetical protein
LLKSNNIVLNLASNRLTLVLNPALGTFTGSVINPSNKQPVVLNGALFQKQNYGSGYLAGTNQIGRVYFGP